MKIAVASFLLLSVLVIVQSCTTLTKEECLNSDWQAIGQRDGERGEHPEWQFKYHVAACKLTKVTPDYTQWYKGFERGLLRYCTPLSGLYFGQRGKPYYKLCLVGTERDFLRGYYLGKKEYGLKSNIGSSEASINVLNSEIDSLLDNIAAAKPEDIPNLRSKIRNKRDEIVYETDRMKEYYRDLTRVEIMVGRFKDNPQLEYDPASL